MDLETSRDSAHSYNVTRSRQPLKTQLNLFATHSHSSENHKCSITKKVQLSLAAPYLLAAQTLSQPTKSSMTEDKDKALTTQIKIK